MLPGHSFKPGGILVRALLSKQDELYPKEVGTIFNSVIVQNVFKFKRGLVVTTIKISSMGTKLMSNKTQVSKQTNQREKTKYHPIMTNSRLEWCDSEIRHVREGEIKSVLSNIISSLNSVCSLGLFIFKEV